MKKLLCVVLSVMLILSYSISAVFADAAEYTVSPDIRLPFGKPVTEFAKGLGIEFNPVPSGSTIIYEAQVKMLNMNKPVNLVFIPGFSGDIVDNCEIRYTDTEVSFEEISDALTTLFGEPEHNVYESIETYIWNDTINGNSYTADRGQTGYTVTISPYRSGIEAYEVKNGTLIRFDETPSQDLIIEKKGDEYVPSIRLPEASGNLPVTDNAQASWDKIKPYLYPDELAKTNYFMLYSNGLSETSTAISMTEGLTDKYAGIDEIIETMKREGSEYSVSGLPLDGLTIQVDNADLLKENGGAYNESDLKKALGTARADCMNRADKPSDWALNDIISAIQTDILPYEQQTGYKDDISRLDFCTIAYQILKDNITSDGKSSFTDTESAEVEALADAGIINGKSDGVFAPNDKITREEAAVILARMADYLNISPGAGGTSKYADDSSISDWAKDSVYRAQALSVMNGLEGGSFAPKNNYTKEQAVVTLMRLNNI